MCIDEETAQLQNIATSGYLLDGPLYQTVISGKWITSAEIMPWTNHLKLRPRHAEYWASYDPEAGHDARYAAIQCGARFTRLKLIARISKCWEMAGL